MRPAAERSTTTSSTSHEYARRTAIRTLAVDAQTVRVMSALAEREVHALLLKGPTVAGLLYGDGEMRDYADTDVLVSPAGFATAEQVLRELGYGREVGERSMALIGSHGYAWRRPDSPIAVDLHHTLPGVAGPPGTLWEALRPYTASIQMRGTAIAVLSTPALAFHIALHAANHGVEGEKPLRDLARALGRVGLDHWIEAAALAARVDAVDAFGTGLRLLPAGVALAAHLRVPASRSRHVTMVAMGAPSVAIAADRLRATPGARAKGLLLLRKAIPPADYLRRGWPLARRGWTGAVVAYPWRLAMLACQAGPAMTAWRRAARVTKGLAPDDAPS